MSYHTVVLQILVNAVLSRATKLDFHYAEKLQSHLHADIAKQHNQWVQANHSCQLHGTHDPVTRLGRNKDPDSSKFSREEDPSETDPFCTLTSNTFLGGRGISVVTKPEIAEKIASLPAFGLKERPVLRDDRPPPYEIKHVVGKGMGMIANRTIFRGERLFANAVTGIFHNEAFLARSAREYRLRTDLIEKAVHQLPGDSRKKFHAMIGQPGGHSEVVGKLNVNTFSEDFGGEEHSIMIPEPARMNHDCRPNAMYYFDPRTLVHYTHAARTIYAGEEITITYIDPLQTREKRLEAIQRSWGFDCACALCTQPLVYTEASDGRIEAINQLVEVLAGTKNRTDNRVTTDEEKPKMAELLVDLYEQERLYSHVADAWMWVALLYQKAGKKWEALKWTYRSEEGILIHEGPGNHGPTRMSNMIFDLSVQLGLEDELVDNA
ncbi:hypothetical protein BJ875DRAFT_527639 [Amylocarpus encephaloides]|uniref:SET domain-containing protein n=1 Tax=Amylocarpus encephaloides TaxID=45428 RepID=A0A9P7Y6X8_9HELO|nr:hypothetical protein BJ875DRAFT_527639 [Amylocarpus encephaloides]